MLSTITLKPPWEGTPIPKLDVRAIKADPWMEGLANEVLNELFTLFTENLQWLILSLVLVAVVGFGFLLWRNLHPGPGPGPRGEQQLPGVKWG